MLSYNVSVRQKNTAFTFETIIFCYINHCYAFPIHLREYIPEVMLPIYRETSNIRRTLLDNNIVDHSDADGVSPVGAAPTTSSFST